MKTIIEQRIENAEKKRAELQTTIKPKTEYKVLGCRFNRRFVACIQCKLKDESGQCYRFRKENNINIIQARKSYKDVRGWIT